MGVGGSDLIFLFTCRNVSQDVWFIPVQFRSLGSSSYPFGHMQTNVPVELSHVYSHVKPEAAQTSVTERKQGWIIQLKSPLQFTRKNNVLAQCQFSFWGFLSDLRLVDDWVEFKTYHQWRLMCHCIPEQFTVYFSTEETACK